MAEFEGRDIPTDEEFHDALSSETVETSLETAQQLTDQVASAVAGDVVEAQERASAALSDVTYNVTIELTSKSANIQIDIKILRTADTQLNAAMETVDRSNLTRTETANAGVDAAANGDTPSEEQGKATTETLQERSQAMEKAANGATKEVKEAMEALEKTAKGVLDKLDEAAKKNEPSPDKSKAGEKRWETIKKIVKWLLGLGALAGLAFGAYAIIKSLADSLTGCYQIKGDDQTQIDCAGDREEGLKKKAFYNDNPGSCRCILSTDNADAKLMDPSTTLDDINTQCKKSSGDLQKLPLCTLASGQCSNVPALVCDSSKGIYYRFEKYTAASLLGDIFKDFGKLFSGLGKGLKAIFMYILYAVLGVIGIVVIVFLLKWTVPLLFKKKARTQQSSKQRGQKQLVVVRQKK